jgi:hypothetical protein
VRFSNHISPVVYSLLDCSNHYHRRRRTRCRAVGRSGRNVLVDDRLSMLSVFDSTTCTTDIANGASGEKYCVGLHILNGQPQAVFITTTPSGYYQPSPSTSYGGGGYAPMVYPPKPPQTSQDHMYPQIDPPVPSYEQAVMQSKF